VIKGFLPHALEQPSINQQGKRFIISGGERRNWDPLIQREESTKVPGYEPTSAVMKEGRAGLYSSLLKRGKKKNGCYCTPPTQGDHTDVKRDCPLSFSVVRGAFFGFSRRDGGEETKEINVS